jgi:hypothetical protein
MSYYCCPPFTVVLFNFFQFINPKECNETGVASPSGRLEAIIVTSLYAALLVLEGRSHTTSSMLEGLYLSILAVCCDEKLTGRHDMKIADLQKCWIIRRGSMLASQPPDFLKVPITHLGFVREMHDLFYPLQIGLFASTYNAKVIMGDFEKVCKNWIKR